MPIPEFHSPELVRAAQPKAAPVARAIRRNPVLVAFVLGELSGVLLTLLARGL